MKKVLVMSDVHGNLELAKEVMKTDKWDHILYLGDWGSEDRSILEENNVIAIQGNHPGENVESVNVIQIEDVKIMMTHGHLFSSEIEYVCNHKLMDHAIEQDNEIKLILHGHTHIKKDEIVDGIRIMNPGSLSIPRDDTKGSYIVLNIDGENIDWDFVLL